MRFLLDTHIALWAVGQPDRLSSRARDLLYDAEALLVSAVALWEIAIKHHRRRGRPDDILLSGRDASAAFAAAGFDFLAISHDHAAAVDDLPPFHGDPFDRLMVAQAIDAGLCLLTHDSKLAAYGPAVLTV